MAGCFAWVNGRKNPARDVKLVIIGLDDAGKTTTIACLQGEPPDGITPTIGFSNANLAIGKWNITIYDLGGGSGVRSVWEKYYAEIYGVIFAVDSGNHLRLVESKNALNEVFKDPKVSGKPVVVFANKQDKDGALNEEQVSEKLDLQELSKQYNFKFNVFSCSAIKGYGKKMDKSIKSGLEWLLNAINQDYSIINEKVTKESALQKEQDIKERKERMERIRKLREEREKAAKEAGIVEDEESDDDVINPFRNIADQIKVTEKREKKAKEKIKKIKAHQTKIDDHYSDEEGTERLKKEGNEDDDGESFVERKKKRDKKKKKKKIKSKTDFLEESLTEKKSNQSKNSKCDGYEDGEFEESDDNRDCTEISKNMQIRGTKSKMHSNKQPGDDAVTRNNTKENKVRKKENNIEDDDLVEVFRKINAVDETNHSGSPNVNGLIGIGRTKVIHVSSKENIRDDTEISRTKNRVEKSKISHGCHRSDSDMENEKNERCAFGRDKTKEAFSNEMIMNDDFIGVDVKWRSVHEKEINDSRAELFLAKSNESLDRENLSRTVNDRPSKEKKKRKGAKADIIEFDDVSNKKSHKKGNSKKKSNKTEPQFSCGSTNTDPFNPSFDADCTANGYSIPVLRSSKLEPIKVKGRKLPTLTNDEDSTLPSWALAKPNFDNNYSMT